MYKRKEEKLTVAKINQTCDDMKQDLIESISYESQRSNVDNAKKRAVAQHMDYDNFKQMVLGANIKPVKTAELSDMLNNKNHKSVMNMEASLAGIQSDDSKTQEELLNAKIRQLSVESDFQVPTNFREFRKAFEKCLEERNEPQEKPDTSATYRRGLEYMKLITVDKYPKIFSADFDAQYFVKITNIFDSLLCEKQVDEVDLEFILRFLKNLSTITGFSFNVLGFLSKTEKQKLSGFLQALDEQINEKFSEDKKQDLTQVITDVKKIYPK